MSNPSIKKRAPRVLLTNDDGYPTEAHSPFIYPFAIALTEQLGWEVKVVVPASVSFIRSVSLSSYSLALPLPCKWICSGCRTSSFSSSSSILF